MEPTMGVGPMTSSLPKRCATPALRGQIAQQCRTRHRYCDACKSGIRLIRSPILKESRLSSHPVSRRWWWEVDSNLRRLRQQIYSLLPLATRASHATFQYQDSYSKSATDSRHLTPDSYTGADDGTRTRNLRFTKPLLCQLSYVGANLRLCAGLSCALHAGEHCLLTWYDRRVPGPSRDTTCPPDST